MALRQIRNRKKGVSIEVLDALIKSQTGLRHEAEILKDIDHILVDYYPEGRVCQRHGTHLLVMKTDTREVRSTSYPPFTARKVFLYCSLCKGEAQRTENYPWKYIPTVDLLRRGKSPFAMDIVTEVGMMKFLKCMRREKIQEALVDRYGISVSDGSLTEIGMEFLARVKCLHELRFGAIVEDIKAGGGYILGIDGTGDGGSDRIFTAIDLIRDWVLLSARIVSEKEKHMTPHLDELRNKAGLPLASVCDMLPSMMNVLKGTMPGVPLRICHYHFIDDIGCDLMDKEYGVARKFIIGSKIRAYLDKLRKSIYHDPEMNDVDISRVARELREGKAPLGLPLAKCIMVQVYDVVSWILRYKEENKGMRFPYCLPYFNLYERLQKGLEAITAIRKTGAEGRTSQKYLRELENKLRVAFEGKDESTKDIRAQIAHIKESYELFERLREKLHIPKEKGDIPRDKLLMHNNEMIAKMKDDLETFREELRMHVCDGGYPKERIVLKHLDKYWSHIVLENAVVNINGEDVMLEIPRTTSSNETCFGIVKGDIRKRLGKKDIGRELNMYGDHLCYVQNLKKEDYVRLVCGSLSNLPRVFEEIPSEMVKKEMELLRNRLIGYDITRNGCRGKRVEFDEIMVGIKAIGKRIEEVQIEEYLMPCELYGRKSNGLLTL